MIKIIFKIFWNCYKKKLYWNVSYQDVTILYDKIKYNIWWIVQICQPIDENFLYKVGEFFKFSKFHLHHGLTLQCVMNIH